MKTAIVILLFVFSALTNYGLNSSPVTVNDTLYGVVGNPLYVTKSFLLKNDYDPDGDSIFVQFLSGSGLQKINDSTWLKQTGAYTESIEYANYRIKDANGNNSVELKNLVFILAGALTFDSLNVNNINALISPVGQHFWNFQTARFEVPKGSGKQSIFNHTIWISGLRVDGNLCTAAERYRQTGADFFVGPVTSGIDTAYYLKWNRVWKTDKEQIRYHINNWNQPGYDPIEVIKNWPGNGDMTLGQSHNIAPFYDNNTNGTYEPLLGDYPLIRGDQAVFFVFNDAQNIHTESKGNALGIEIHGMAYGYDRPDDSTLNNTLFMHYDIVNLSAYNYHDAYIGLFADFDLGYALDDYIASDVANGMAYCYNGLPTDGSGQPDSYGDHPPAIGMKVIGGPLLEPDGIDNPAGECGKSLNGLNFGDNIADNERLGMTNFIYFSNSESSYMQDPSVSIEYYNYMRGNWRDGSKMIYGGNGHLSTGGVGPDCNFMFPGNSDTACNYGTNGILPEGGYNQNGYYWNEATTLNAPGDRRGLASVGPFNFTAGQTIPLDYCFTWARDYTGDNNSSAELLRERIAALAPYWNNLITSPVTYFAVPDVSAKVSIRVYPNPVHNQAIVSVEETEHYLLYSANGVFIAKGKFNPGKNLLDLSNLKPGVYILQCRSRNVRIVKM